MGSKGEINHMNIEMRLAHLSEAEICAVFIHEAREYQNAQGFVQWTEEYPNINTIIQDINEKKGYILTDDNTPFGYLCIDFGGEPAYDVIDGKWKSNQNYAVIHRMAFGKQGRGKGASRIAFQLAKRLCISKHVFSIRVDTDHHNKGMQHILKQEGYQYCGTVIFENSPKLAYELMF